MNTVGTCADWSADDMSVYSESEEARRSIRRLLSFGWEMGLPTSVTETKASQRSDSLAQQFQTLAKAWHDECGHLSSAREMILHPVYQQIVGKGPRILPFIFAELERKPDHWFWALRAITQEDPVPPEHRGNVAQMTRDWLEWSERKGICR